MSELVVAGFPDVLRAAQVVTELQRMDRLWTDEVEHAVTVAYQDDGRLLVQQTIDPSAGNSAAWSGLWAALIRETLMVATEGILEAATAVEQAVAGNRPGIIGRDARSQRPSWWAEEVGLPPDFMRDVGALIGPGESALFILLREIDAARASRQLRRLGGTVLHCPLDASQGAKVQTVLAGSAT